MVTTFRGVEPQSRTVHFNGFTIGGPAGRTEENCQIIQLCELCQANLQLRELIRLIWMINHLDGPTNISFLCQLTSGFNASCLSSPWIHVIPVPTDESFFYQRFFILFIIITLFARCNFSKMHTSPHSDIFKLTIDGQLA